MIKKISHQLTMDLRPRKETVPLPEKKIRRTKACPTGKTLNPTTLRCLKGIKIDKCKCCSLPMNVDCDVKTFAKYYFHTQRKINELKSSKNPWFIVSWGPPASGKGACRREYLDSLKITSSGAIDILVDDMIGIITEYVNEMQWCKNDGGQCDSSKIYFKYRNYGNEIRELVLQHSLENKYNIIWETTGKDTDRLDKMIPLLKKMGYRIGLVFPYVQIDTIIFRNDERAKRIGRRPDPDLIRDIYEKAQTNLLQQIFPSNQYDKIILYDNEKAKFCSRTLMKYTRKDGIKCHRNWSLVIRKHDALYSWMLEKCN
jgi:hypothetical protein